MSEKACRNDNNANNRLLVSSGSPMEQSIGFSRAVRVGNFIAVSGTAPLNPDGSDHGPGDLYAQTVRCFEITEQAVKEAGGCLENVIRTRIMLTDISRWEEAAKAHRSFFLLSAQPVLLSRLRASYVRPG